MAAAAEKGGSCVPRSGGGADLAERSMFPSGQQKLFDGSVKTPTLPMDTQVLQVEVYKVPHLREWIKESELASEANRYMRHLTRADTNVMRSRFITEGEVILADIARSKSKTARSFIRAGMRERLVWKRDEVRAAIVTCGGLCPGLNDVVEQIVETLYYHYGVDDIFGVRNGYRGFYEESRDKNGRRRGDQWVELTPDKVDRIHLQGGTWLGSSRGGFDLDKIVGAVKKRRINQVYIIGGDGTHRAADKIFHETRRQGLKVCVAAVPKTIDNDIGVIDHSFGFHTAVNEAQKAIESARVEASCTPNGVGIVTLMGRECGMIAAHSTIANREVDLCLIPEVPFALAGQKGVLHYLDQVIRRKGFAVVVVAEGAGVEVMRAEAGEGDGNPATEKKDASGNRVLPPIGAFLKQRVKKYFAGRDTPVSIKYHDPSYMIRSVPPIASDASYCMILAQNAVHGAMAGFTGFTSAMVNGRTVYMPIQLVTETSPCRLNPCGRTWERVVSTTQQPVFDKPGAAAKK